jgi:hypothetical protein
MIKWLRQEYESIFEDGTGQMTVNRGKVHTYLGMKLDYSSPGRVKISQFEYIEEIITAFDKADRRRYQDKCRSNKPIQGRRRL